MICFSECIFQRAKVFILYSNVLIFCLIIFTRTIAALITKIFTRGSIKYSDSDVNFETWSVYIWKFENETLDFTFGWHGRVQRVELASDCNNPPTSWEYISIP